MELITTGVIVAIVMGIAQMFKGFGFNSKFIPAINFMLGVMLFVAAFLLGISEESNIGMAVFNGMVAGLTASGLYSGVKNIGQGISG